MQVAAVAATEDRASTNQEVGEEPHQGEGEDPQAVTLTNIWITRPGMKNNPQEEEEEARNGKKTHGESTKCNKEVEEITRCNQEVAETPQIIGVIGTVMWENITHQTMDMAPGREKEVLAPEDIRTETTVQEKIKKEEEVIETSAQEIEETEVTEVIEKVEVVGGSMAITVEKTAQGP